MTQVVGETEIGIPEDQRPECELVGHDGNIFGVLARARRALRSAGFHEKSEEMVDRVKNEADDYDHALRIIMDYVDAY